MTYLRIKGLRQTLDLTQEEMANKLGISRQYMNTIENGGELPSTAIIQKLAELTGLTYKEFINKYGYDVSDND